ncbi:MAG: hypothetical protein HYX96_07780 [Chloroflexi bacterium]|nr:hypothetical protein [Chloroflexota bacterium]
MKRKHIGRLLGVTAVTLVTAALMQELSKPRDARTWSGKIGNVVPYDLRPPTPERVKKCFWDPDSPRLFKPEPFGFGWGINLHAVIDRLSLNEPAGLSEEDFLMPNLAIKRLISPANPASRPPPGR